MAATAEGAFPTGLKVMVVDDDPLCLKVIEKMLLVCKYQVTTCQSSTHALEILREGSTHFDLVLSDVYMPDMDGFKLLELIGLELGLPVIMMSSNGDTNVVFRGVTHGAVDFLIKPVRVEELRNLWQHVVRKTLGGHGSQAADRNHSEEVDGDDEHKRQERKRKESVGGGSPHKSGARGGDQFSDADGHNHKKQRVVWSVEMHQQFVNAVNQLGVDKAVPKRILDLMDVEGLTRENVASHLQKYRLYLKRVQGINNSNNAGHNGASVSKSSKHKGGLGGEAGTPPVAMSPMQGAPMMAAAPMGMMAPAGMVMAMGPEGPSGFMPPAFMAPMPGMMMAGPVGMGPPMMAMPPPPHMMSQASMMSSTSLPPGDVAAPLGGVMPPEATAGMAHNMGVYGNGHMQGGMAPSYAMQGGVVTNGYGAPATMMGGMAGPGASNAPGGLDANLQAELVKLCDQVDAGDLALDSGGDAFMGPFSEALAPTDMLGHGKDGHNDELMSLLLKDGVME